MLRREVWSGGSEIPKAWSGLMRRSACEGVIRDITTHGWPTDAAIPIQRHCQPSRIDPRHSSAQYARVRRSKTFKRPRVPNHDPHGPTSDFPRSSRSQTIARDQTKYGGRRRTHNRPHTSPSCSVCDRPRRERGGFMVPTRHPDLAATGENHTTASPAANAGSNEGQPSATTPRPTRQHTQTTVSPIRCVVWWGRKACGRD